MSPRSAALSLAFANVGHVFTHLLMLLYPTVVLALEGRYGLSYGELLALSLPGFVLYGVAALPAGWLGDRWSAEYMIVIYFLGSGGAATATGLASGPVGLAIGLIGRRTDQVLAGGEDHEGHVKGLLNGSQARQSLCLGLNLQGEPFSLWSEG